MVVRYSICYEDTKEKKETNLEFQSIVMLLQKKKKDSRKHFEPLAPCFKQQNEKKKITESVSNSLLQTTITEWNLNRIKTFSSIQNFVRSLVQFKEKRITEWDLNPRHLAVDKSLFVQFTTLNEVLWLGPSMCMNNSPYNMIM